MCALLVQPLAWQGSDCTPERAIGGRSSGLAGVGRRKRREAPSAQDGLLVSGAHGFLEPGARAAFDALFAVRPRRVTHGVSVDDTQVGIGWCGLRGSGARRAARRDGGALREIENGQGIADERSAIEGDLASLRQPIGDLVDAFVARDPRVPPNVVPGDRPFPTRAHELVERLPQLTVQDVAAGGRLPSAPAPSPDPLADALDDVGRVRVDGYLTLGVTNRRER